MRRAPLDGKLLYWLFATMLVMGVLTEGLLVVLLVVAEPFFRDDTFIRTLLLPLVLIGTGFFGLVAAATLRRGESVGVMRITVIVAVGAGVLVAAHLMFGDQPLSVNADGRFAGWAAILLILMTLIGQADRQKIDTPVLQSIRRLIYVNAALYSGLLILLTWLGWWYSVITFEVLVPWGVLSLLAFAAVPVAAAAGRGRRRHPMVKESIPARISLLLTCPKCGFAQTLPTGLVRCAGCHCPLVIYVEEPRCQCGYLLYQLEGETCPECGCVIDSERRWVMPRD